ncbi:MAG: primosomal protein N' [Bacteroidetes bacterium]|nr:primosomal protein N' [Bacteroidota bacterium]
MTEKSNNRYYIKVVVPLPLPNLFTYSVPDTLISQIEIGKRVLIQFGSQKIYAAIVIETPVEKSDDYEVKPIISIIDEMPVVTEKQIAMWHWVHSYYLCFWGDVMQAALPAELRLSSETKIVLNTEKESESEYLTDDEFLILEALHSVKELSLKEISRILDRKHVFPVVKTLLQKKLVLSVENIGEDFKIPMANFIRRTEQTNDQDFLKRQFDLLEKKAPRQLDVLMQLLLLEKNYSEGKVPQKVLLHKSGVTAAVLKQLLKKGLIEILTERATGTKSFFNKDFFELSVEQSTALKEINKSFTEKPVTLLHGVTSSGKTELYIRLIDDCLKKGRQALYLLPEIALTTQIITRLEKHFGNKLMVYHSRFSDNERASVYTRMIENGMTSSEPFVVIGARSSVFLPFHKLGLVIVDEEHEASYKQFDPSPRYHARDTAIVLAKLFEANVLLGSATPSIETYHNAITGKYGLVELFARHAAIAPPQIQLVNIKELTFKRQMKSHFSPALINAIKEELDKGKQIILFQNRRGFAPILQCHQCNWVPHCQHCDVALTYYKKADLLRCHYCGFTQQPPSKCKSCGETDIRQYGFGTEKIEDELQIFFPEHNIARLDLDSTRGKHAYSEIISRFETGETDILVGTQMVTKGLDFDNVSLVGILNADNLINFPDFRAYERSFQMLMQVSGRAGRKKEQGKVIIQSYNPGHSLLDFVVKNDYKSFIDYELSERKKFNYPPFSRLLEITVKGRDESRTAQAANFLTSELKKQIPSILGPVTPPVSRIKNFYIRTILIKFQRQVKLSEARQRMLSAIDRYKINPVSKNILLQIDVDPI